MLSDLRSALFLLFFVGVIYYAVWSADYIWHRLELAEDDILDLMTGQPDREQLKGSLHRLTAPRLTYPLFLCAAVGLSVVIYGIVRPAVGSFIIIGWGSYAVAAILGAIACEDLYWTLVILPFLVRRVLRQPPNLLWFEPVSTPGLDELSRILAWSALLCSGGGIVFVYPMLYAFARSSSLGVAVCGLMTLTLAFLSLYVTGFSVQWQIHRVVRAHKALTLRTLRSHICDIQSASSAEQVLEADQLADVWRSVSRTANWSLRHETLVQYIAAATTTLSSAIVSIVVARMR